jgi:signal transduction histidine kinase
MRWHIRSQLLLPLILLLLGVVGSSVATGWSSASQARHQIEERLRNVARCLTEDSWFPLTEEVLHRMKSLAGADFLLVRPDGKYLSTLANPGPPPNVEVEADWRSLHLGPTVHVGNDNYLCGAIRLKRGEMTGNTLYIFYPESLWRDALWEAIRPALLLGGLVGGASLLLALGLAGGLRSRIRELQRRTQLIAAGDFSPMPLPSRNDEIRDLARSVNELAEQLAQFQKTTAQTERLRLLGQVSGGLAHQMRNGLTGARLAVQLFLNECGNSTDTSPLSVALRQLTLLETHLKRFLELGRGGWARAEPCSLRTLVSEAVELVRPQCRHAGIVLDWHPPESAMEIHGDSGQLGGLLLNVLGNAIEAAGPGGEVGVHLTSQEAGKVVLLEVSDNGPGPPTEIADRLFEPFVTGKPEGVGLGLAVARQVAEAHSGRISWTRHAGRTRFQVQLSTGDGLPPRSHDEEHEVRDECHIR